MLEDFLKTDPILAFDYDGTLAPICKDAGHAEMRPKTRLLLTKVCRRYPCALLTGRARKDVLAHLKGIPFKEVLGNHGAEGAQHHPSLEARMIARTSRWCRILEQALHG